MSETPLCERLRQRILTDGPISVAEYVAQCLGDPKHGYYATREPFGRAGDFVTAPEISQMFGEIVGAWMAEAWRLSGAPSVVSFIELGPGRGTMMSDMLRVVGRVPALRQGLSVHLVETSPVLRRVQQTTLVDAELPIHWHKALDELPAGPLLLVANEFFDALPVRQFVRSGGAWRERVIGLDASGSFTFGIGPGVLAAGPDAPEGAVMELRPAADAMMTEIARRIVEDGGATLVIDYGYSETAVGETLQAVRRHLYADPLEAPGEADLTAHVDFAALTRAAAAAGAWVHGPMPQGAFLRALGLEARAARLAAHADEAGREALDTAVDRLAAPDQMGTLFKVLAVTRPDVEPPPFGVRTI